MLPDHGETQFHNGAEWGHNDVLVALGSWPQQHCSLVNEPNRMGESALDLAVMNGNAQGTYILLNMGADPEIIPTERNHSWCLTSVGKGTPIMSMSKHGLYRGW